MTDQKPPPVIRPEGGSYNESLIFQNLFGRDAASSILSMNEAGDDIASQAPDLKISINKVGCTTRKTYVSILDPLSHQNQITVFANVDVSVGVHEEKRGIHVSRLSDSIARVSEEKTYQSISDFSRYLAQDIIEKQTSPSAEVYVEADYITYADVIAADGGKSKRTQDHLLLLSATRLDQTIGSFQRTGIEFHHITACPCVQKMFKYATGVDTGYPNLTHSQRSITRLWLENAKSEIEVRDLLQCADAAVFRVRDTLPRPGELALVFESHKNPQFIEDVVRKLALQAYRDFGTENPDAAVLISSVSLESIHTFDMMAELRATMKEIETAAPSCI